MFPPQGLDLLTFLCNLTPSSHQKVKRKNLHSCKSFLPTSTGWPSWDYFQHIEPYSLWQRSALANNNMIPFFHTEAWGYVSWDVWMPLLISLVFFDIMKVVPSDCDGPRHLGTMASTSKNATPDRNIASEGALLVDIGTFNGLSGCLKPQSNALPVSIPSFSRSLSLSRLLRAEKHLRLLQKRLLRLFRHGEGI